MSPKELNYMEDALAHEQQLSKKYTALVSQIQDKELKKFVKGLATRHQQRFSKLLAQLQ